MGGASIPPAPAERFHPSRWGLVGRGAGGTLRGVGRGLARFEGITAVVTGASSGIGRELALALAAEKARVALVARREAKLREVAGDVERLGGEASVFVCDVADSAAVETTARAIEEQLGPVELLINNAGVGRHRLFVEDALPAARALLDVNVVGAMAFTRALVPAMTARRRGFVVFMGSIAGLVPVPGEAVYSASKFALVGFADALSLELEPLGVHVLTVCPGAVRTDFARHERERLVPAAVRGAIAPEVVATRTLRALRAGERRAVVPARLSVAHALRGLWPELVRRGTRAAVRAILPAPRGER